MVKVLLLNGRTGQYWTNLLLQAVTNLGGTLTVLNRQDLEDKACVGFDLIILDASVVKDLPLAVRTIRSSNQWTRIIVVAPTLHWKQARETLLLGGTDYVRKVDDPTALMDILRESLSRAPSAYWDTIRNGGKTRETHDPVCRQRRSDTRKMGTVLGE